MTASSSGSPAIETSRPLTTQVSFLSSKKLGIEMDQVVVFRKWDIYNDIKGPPREELRTTLWLLD